MNKQQQIVKDYYSRFNERDWQGMLKLVDDQVIHEPNQGETRLGKDRFREFLQHMDETYEEQLEEMRFYTSEEEYVAVTFTVNGVYKKSEEGLPPAHGQTYKLPAAAFLTVRDGRIQRVATFYNLPHWIKLVSDGAA